MQYLAEIVLNKLPCLASGCAGVTPPPPPSGGTTVEACALLTDDEIKTATHFTTTGHEAGQPTDCRWTLDTDTKFPGLHAIVLSILTSGGRQRFDFMARGHGARPWTGR